MYRGIILKESLLDELILDLIVIEKVEIWKVENHATNQPKYWTAISFNVNSEKFANEMSKAIKEEWYVDFGNNVEKIIVFKNKIFKYKLGDSTGKQRAIDYCRKIGVPEAQIDWCE